MLVGRDSERAAIETLLREARSGVSGALALVGEPGIGKTVLLEHAAEQAASSGMRLLRARGVESEAQIPFGSLLELLRPALSMLDQIPEPQTVALAQALALRHGGQAYERFAVGAATLSLLSAYAEAGPLTMIIDDAHWLDRPSAQAMLFALRRLVADPIASLLATRDGEPSFLDGTDIPSLRLDGLGDSEITALIGDMTPDTAARLRRATGGNPLALLELEVDAEELEITPDAAPLLLSTRLAGAFLHRAELLEPGTRRALLLAATSDSGDLQILSRAAVTLGVELEAIGPAEAAGLISVRDGRLEFRHPLVRSAVYADASIGARREAHRALASALPDTELDRRAWHLAASAAGIDEPAALALESAAARSRDRAAFATAASGFARAAQLSGNRERRAGLLLEAAGSAWSAGLADRAMQLLDASRAATANAELEIRIDRLAGQILIRRGPVMRGHSILTAAAARAEPDLAIELLSDAAIACFVAAEPVEMLAVTVRASAVVTPQSSPRSRFLAATALGAARIVGGDAAAGAVVLREAIAIAEANPGFTDEPALLPWLAIGPIFLREADAGRTLLEHALGAARARAAIGSVPFVLNLIARDQATTDHWAVAEATYAEAIGLARECGQRAELAFGLAGIAWLYARQGRAQECRATARESLEICRKLGTRLWEIWATAALGELELAFGNVKAAAAQLEVQRRLIAELEITDVDLWPAAELVEAYVRLGRAEEAVRLSEDYLIAAEIKGQPWSLGRARRCQGLTAPDGAFTEHFEQALAHHAMTRDIFETARTRLAYGERLRRSRGRVLARKQLREAERLFDRLGARPWSQRSRTELEATGERLRRGEPSTIEELTAQELQIAMLLGSGRTTREAAASLFLSPKTIEYHLHHVYMKLGIHSRPELAEVLARQSPQAVRQ